MPSVVTTRNTAWVTSRTWTAGELVTASIMNAHVRDQLNALKSPAYFRCYIDEASDYSIVATSSFTDIDATDLGATITTGGGAMLITFQGNFIYSAGVATALYLSISVDGTTQVTDDGIVRAVPSSSTLGFPSTFVWLVPALSAGSHTFKLQWKTGATGTYIMYAGAGTSTGDMHPLFTGIELL